jgi:hypothetical protein
VGCNNDKKNLFGKTTFGEEKGGGRMEGSFKCILKNE